YELRSGFLNQLPGINSFIVFQRTDSSTIPENNEVSVLLGSDLQRTKFSTNYFLRNVFKPQKQLESIEHFYKKNKQKKIKQFYTHETTENQLLGIIVCEKCGKWGKTIAELSQKACIVLTVKKQIRGAQISTF
ncbi:MAG: hypothetical protein Q7R33_00325, partial [Nitrosarchaeum sp.]|nr:hypothetical protein [Nitrosarchaeum sp.]